MLVASTLNDVTLAEVLQQLDEEDEMDSHGDSDHNDYVDVEPNTSKNIPKFNRKRY